MKKFFIVLMVISIICNIYFICYILGKGITLNNYNTYHQEQYQQQWSGQLLINQWVSQGNHIEWKRMIITKEKDTLIELNKLHPISSLYSKVICMDNGYIYEIIYPDVFNKK